MKKILAFCLALLLTGCLQACVSEQGVPVPGKTTPEAEQAAPGTEEEIPEMTETPAAAEAVSAGEMTLLSINVRKADAHLLRCGDTAYLVDTGTSDSIEQLTAVLQQQGITRLDGVILTHTHQDHAGGLKKLLKSGITVDRIYASAYYNMDKEDHPAVKALKKNDVEITWLSGGDTLPFGEGILRVIGPIAQDPDKENNNSLVLLASAGGGTLLLTGDMEFPEEASLIRAGLIPHADVIKIGNHGEDDATSTDLIRTAAPSLAVISTNTEDEPDTPSLRVMKLLDEWNVKVLQTQDTENGVLVTFCNGEILTDML